VVVNVTVAVMGGRVLVMVTTEGPLPFFVVVAVSVPGLDWVKGGGLGSVGEATSKSFCASVFCAAVSPAAARRKKGRRRMARRAWMGRSRVG
jgi:hypothetical protein